MVPDFGDLMRVIDRSNATVLEIGANDGTDSLRFLEHLPYASLFCFEPEPRCIAKHRNRVRDSRAHLFDIGIGATTGTQTFYQSSGVPTGHDAVHFPGEWDMSGSIRKPKLHLEHHPWCEFNQTIQIEVMRLDDWRQRENIKGIDFIWADVQGAEGDLIAGGLETLSQTRLFFTEYSNQELYEGELGLEQILARLPDFELLQLFDGDALFVNRALK